MTRGQGFLWCLILAASLFGAQGAAGQATGYWRQQGPPRWDFCGYPRQVNSETYLEVVDYDANHATMKVSGRVGGGQNTMVYRYEWVLPPVVVPGQVIPGQSKAVALSVSYERPNWPRLFKMPLLQWCGYGTPVEYLADSGVTEVTRAGQTRAGVASTEKARGPRPGFDPEGNFQLHVSCFHGPDVYFPYVWVKGVPPASPASTAPTLPSPAREVVALHVKTDRGVSNGPTARTRVAFSVPTLVNKIMTYHYNGGKGATPGTVGLRNLSTGETLGPWRAVGSGQWYDMSPNGTWPMRSDPPFLYWYVQPAAQVPPGSYEVVDSDPGTWATNSDVKGVGIAIILASPVR